MNVDAIALAAQSSDPGVRLLAARRMELEAEIREIDGLFATLNRLVERTRNAQLLTELENMPGEDGVTMPKQEFVTVLRGILTRNGKPMRAADLFTEFRLSHPNHASIGADGLRKRLYLLRDHFRSIDQGLWWPADMVLAVAENSVAA